MVGHKRKTFDRKNETLVSFKLVAFLITEIIDHKSYSTYSKTLDENSILC